MDRTYHTFPLSDEILIKQLIEISTKLGLPNPTITLQLDTQAGNSIESTPDKLLEDPKVKKILELNASAIGFARLIMRSPHQHQVEVTRDAKSGEVSVRVFIAPQVDFCSAAQVSAFTQALFKPYERNEAIDKLLGDQLAEFYRHREHALLKLEEISQNLIERNEEYRRTIDFQRQTFENEMSAKYAKKTEELERDYDHKREELQSRQKELEAKQKELDDRSSTHARRQLRQDLKKAVADRSQKFSLTRETRRKRYVIHGVFVSMIGFLVYIVVTTLLRGSPTGSTTVDWYTLVKLPCATIAALLALAWYIRWNDNWFRQHADEEFDTKRFELDIDRASWVVEMAFEWHAEKGTQIPPELIDRLTANLFTHRRSEAPQHPSQDLASALLGASSELNLNLPRVGQLKLDRKGTEAFKKTLDTDKS